MSDLSVLQLHGPQSSTCGYCGPPGQRSASRSYHSIGATAIALTCSDYQQMVDRGWRRSGDYCYKPDMRRTCCPQYTIKLDSLNFVPTKKQRKVLYRWNRFVLEGTGDSEVADDPMTGAPSTNSDHSKAKSSKKPPPFSLVDCIHSSEAAFAARKAPPKHKFEVTLEPPSYTAEKFELYRHYQQNVHKEEKEHRPTGFENFLVESPLKSEPIPYDRTPPDHLPKNYGSYHQLYRLDGELIAMAVLDILPSCVSSVYFMYNTKWERFSLGKLSALRESTLAQEMHEYGLDDTKYLYMGFYVHSCQKMKYKGEYSPSFLLDPEDYNWHPLKACLRLLNEYRYACFSHPEHSLKGDDVPENSPVEMIDMEELSQMKLCSKPGEESLSKYYVVEVLFRTIHGLGLGFAKNVILVL